MLKFLRKYMKIILAVFGTILMILFLLPAGIDSYGQSARIETIGTIGDEEITTIDRQNAKGEIDLVSSFLGGRLPFGLDQSNGDLHWILLLREAERQGAYVSRNQL